MKKKKLMALLLSGILAFSLIGCGKKDVAVDPNAPAKTEERAIGGTLVAGITECSGCFNPAYYTSAYDGNVVSMVFDSLLVVDVDGNLQPSACKSYEYSEDKKDITFKLRDDMTFSDGEKVTAEDIVFSYQMIADPSYTGRYGSAVKDLVGYEDYFAGKTTEFKGVVAVDDYTVKFCFNEPLRTNLTNCTQAIMPKHYYGKDWTIGNTAPIEALSAAPVGSGPYTLEKFEETKFVSLKRNPKYYGEGYSIENVVLKFVEETTEMSELTSKAVDLLPAAVDPEKLNEAKSKDFLTVNDYDRSGYGYIKFNCQNGPTAEVKVRQALYYGFNIKEFVDSYYKDEATGKILASRQQHPFNQQCWAIDDKLKSELNTYEFDLEKAAALLDEAGWKVGASGYREKNGKVMELNIAALPDHDILNTLIPMWQRDWEGGLKVKLNVAYLEFNTMLDYVTYNSDDNVDKWNLFFLACTIPTPDPDQINSTVNTADIGSGKDNECRYSNKEVDKLLAEGKKIIDKEEAKPVYQKIIKILNEECPIVPVYCNTYHDLYNTKIKNLKTSAFCDWVVGLKDAYIEE